MFTLERPLMDPLGATANVTPILTAAWPGPPTQWFYMESDVDGWIHSLDLRVTRALFSGQEPWICGSELKKMEQGTAEGTGSPADSPN
ncbi:hypothetical protein EYF80_053568 [Liparis tanakae]|uniref:Uncharacterized protein n=1 Tax=Liparis tanakae TaxID=230148 RepID=A0A4Z2F5T4_9TELE|nr:hypothetical protein EYF80_053568 [Liparis tanakae]